MKHDLQISIPKPCSANWDKMTPVEQGKFCGLCSLTVVDFTEMTETEIKEYFTCHYGQKTCGRFKASQVVTENVAKEKYYNRSFKTLFLSCLALLGIMVACRRTPTLQPEVPLMGAVAMPEDTSFQSPAQLMGETIYKIEKKDVK